MFLDGICNDLIDLGIKADVFMGYFDSISMPQRNIFKNRIIVVMFIDHLYRGGESEIYKGPPDHNSKQAL